MELAALLGKKGDEECRKRRGAAHRVQKEDPTNGSFRSNKLQAYLPGRLAAQGLWRNKSLMANANQALGNSPTQAQWPFGSIRGGSPALRCGDYYLTIFHSYLNRRALRPKPKRLYYMGAYLFENKPPFRMIKISSSPLGEKEDYLTDNLRKIVFPAGLVIQENEAIIAFGRNDNGISLMRVNLDSMLSSMVPIAAKSP